MDNKIYYLNNELVYREEDKNLFYLNKMVVYNLNGIANKFIYEIKNGEFSYDEAKLIYENLSDKIDKEYFPIFFKNLIDLKILKEKYE